MRLGFPDAGNDPPDTMTRQAYDLITEGFGPGTNGPLVIAAELPDPRAQGATSTPWRASCAASDGVAFVTAPRINRRRRRGADHRDPDHLAPGRGDRGPGQAICATTSCPQTLGGTGDHRRGRRRDRGARGPERLHDGPHAAVHRRRRRPLLPAAAGRLPLAADLAQGGGDEPALGQRRLRRDDAGGAGRRGRRADRDRPRGARSRRSCR